MLSKAYQNLSSWLLFGLHQAPSLSSEDEHQFALIASAPDYIVLFIVRQTRGSTTMTTGATRGSEFRAQIVLEVP
jgi:hypothetical protein